MRMLIPLTAGAPGVVPLVSGSAGRAPKRLTGTRSDIHVHSGIS